MIVDVPSLKDAGLVGLALFFLIDRAFTWLRRYNLVIPGADKETREHTKAGEKSVEFWQLEQSRRFDSGLRAMREQLIPLVDIMIRIEAQHTEIMRQHGDILQILRNIRNDQRNRRQDSSEL